MWQVSISADTNQEFAINKIYNSIKDKTKELGGVIIKDYQGARPRISLACELGKSGKLEKKLVNILIDVIMSDYKLDYIKKNSNVAIPNKVNYNAYLKALVLFDRNYERSLVEQRMILGENVSLDGIINFRLRPLLERWDEICKLATISNAYIEAPQTYIDLLVFLVSYLDSRAKKINIKQLDDKYRLEINSDSGRPDSVIVDKYELMPSIIEYNPLSIEIDCDCRFDSDNMYLLGKLYSVHNI